jgi:hypothetical protein
VHPSEGEKSYSDLMVVREYRKIALDAKKEAKVASRTADETLKWLSWPEFLAVVQVSGIIAYESPRDL